MLKFRPLIRQYPASYRYENNILIFEWIASRFKKFTVIGKVKSFRIHYTYCILKLCKSFKLISFHSYPQIFEQHYFFFMYIYSSCLCLLENNFSISVYRKGGLLLNNFVGIGGACLMGFAKFFRSYEVLFAGRFIIGVNCGKYLHYL